MASIPAHGYLPERVDAKVYCRRKLGPPPKPRLCYNDNLIEFQRQNFSLNFTELWSKYW